MKCALPWSQAVCSVLLYAELHACTMLHARVHPRESTAGAQFSHPRTDSGIPPSRARTRRSSSSCPCPGPAFHCARAGCMHAQHRHSVAGRPAHNNTAVCRCACSSRDRVCSRPARGRAGTNACAGTCRGSQPCTPRPLGRFSSRAPGSIRLRLELPMLPLRDRPRSTLANCPPSVDRRCGSIVKQCTRTGVVCFSASVVTLCCAPIAVR
jgi:hypothetical protein